MVMIICGEDEAASRNFLLELVEKYRTQNFELQRIAPSEIETINSTSSSPGLFSQKRVLLVENLNKAIRKKGDRIQAFLENFDKDKEIELVIWEGGISQRDLKLKKIGKIKEFKPQNNIFKLLDACYPTNLRSFLSSLSEITDPQNEIFILTMLQRHIRTLLLIKSGGMPSTLQSWQLGKLKSQSGFWSSEKLMFFYDGLYKIDESLKSGKNPYGIKKSLDILACHYLK